MTPRVQLIRGDARRIPLADGSVHTVVTSPPYYALRDYGTARWEGGDPACDHKPALDLKRTASRSSNLDRNGSTRNQEEAERSRQQYRDACGKCDARRVDSQLGLEDSPEAYVAAMVGVFAEVWRVMRDDACCFVNIGDSYGSGEIGRHDRKEGRRADGGDYDEKERGEPRQQRRIIAGVKQKDLLGIPWMLAFALRDFGFYLRSEIIWSKVNPMPESVTDRPTKAHEQIFLLTKRPRYYYDADAVREANEGGLSGGRQYAQLRGEIREKRPTNGQPDGQGHNMYARDNPAGRNIRSVWSIASNPYPGSHFATMPLEIALRCIKAGTSERGVCPACGAPWVRVVERGEIEMTPRRQHLSAKQRQGHPEFIERVWPTSTLGAGMSGDVPARSVTTTGWQPSCACDAGPPVPAIVFDPFGGASTTPLAARMLGRHGIATELNPEYLALSQARLRQHTSGKPDGPRVKPLDGQLDLFASRETRP